jgi:hypothetical protein
MACYEHLPIYKKFFDLAVHFEKVVVGLSRYHKYTLGTELRWTLMLPHQIAKNLNSPLKLTCSARRSNLTVAGDC